MNKNEKIIQDFIDSAKSIQEETKKNRKNRFLGWISTYVPEEIIIAAGFIPFRITGTTSPISLSKTYFSGNISSYIQGCLEGALRQEYTFLEGVIIGGETDAMKRLCDTWLYFAGKDKLFISLLDIPKLFTPDLASKHYKESISSLIERIEKYFNKVIDDNALFNAITICQKTRGLLNRLNNLRRTSLPIINSLQMSEICKLSVSGDKEIFNKELETLLQQLEEQKNYKESSLENKPRLMMTGSFQEGTELLHVVENSGGMLVCEDLSDRIRYFRTTVQIDRDPVSAIVMGYLNKPPSASVADHQKRAEYILDLIKEFRIDGVIYYVLKFDDPYLFEFPDIKEILNQNNIPIVRIETEASRISEGQIKTRLQAFIDTLSITANI